MVWMMRSKGLAAVLLLALILSAGTATGSDCDRVVRDTSSQTSGNLPNDAVSVVSLDDGPGGGSDEGRAIAELIADIAPGRGTGSGDPIEVAAIINLSDSPANLFLAVETR